VAKVMTQSTSNDRQIRGIKRTICIGLGGTGRDVLMYIRRLIVDRYGSLDRLPIVRFVHIDTDQASTQVSSLPTGNVYNGQSLSFKLTETVNATMSAPDVDNFVRGLKRSLDSDRRGPYDNIRPWFPQGLLNNIKAVEEGAKGIRPVGRLAFFHNYRKIQDAIARAEQLTRNAPPTFVKTGLRVEPGLNIFVVGSLCGGTGSGMFLDVAYSLRRNYGDQEGAQIVGYLVISPKLYGDTPNMKANTYAALKELDYFSNPNTQFEAIYDPQNLIWVDKEMRPPFDYTYLVSSQTQGEYVVDKQSKLCNVIAHKIALDFSGELASVVRGMRDNFLQHMISLDDHPRPNVQRYLTFGLAAIYFPRDVIAQIALSQISQRLLTYWLNGKGQSPDPVKLLGDFLTQRRWREEFARKDNFTVQLKEKTREANQTFSSTLSTWRSNLDQPSSDYQDANVRKIFLEQIPREVRTQFRSVQYSEIERDRGIWLTRLTQASVALEAQLKQDIDFYLQEILTPGNPNFSIKNARDWLDALQSDLQENQRSLQDQIQDLNGFKTLDELDKIWKDAEQIIEDNEHKSGIPFISNRSRPFYTEVKGALDKTRSLLGHNFELATTREALNLTISLQKNVQDRAVHFATFDRIVDGARAEYERRIKDLKQLSPDEMSGEPIFNADEIESYHRQLLPQNRASDDLASLSLEIIEQLERGSSLIGFVNQDRPTQQQLADEIRLSVDRVFGVRGSEVESVIKQFIRTYGSAEREYRLNQILEEAQPLLRLNLADPYFRRTPAKSTRLIGFQDVDELEVRQFKQLLTQNLGIPINELHPVQAQDEILFVTEYAGFPLRLIRGLDQMRLSYLRERDALRSFLHLHPQDLLTDIIPPDAETLDELEDTFYPCLAFGIIQEGKQPYRLEFQYRTGDFRGIIDMFHLSPLWNKAIEELATRPQMAEILKQQLEEIVSLIHSDPELLKQQYLPLLSQFVASVEDFPETHLNFSCKATVVGTSATLDMNLKEGVIERFVRRIRRQIPPTLPGI